MRSWQVTWHLNSYASLSSELDSKNWNKWFPRDSNLGDAVNPVAT